MIRISAYARLGVNNVSDTLPPCRVTTYLRPIQFLGPKLKGCITFLLSLAYLAGGSLTHLSGTNISGSVKLLDE
jgi:hypothetical protein